MLVKPGFGFDAGLNLQPIRRQAKWLRCFFWWRNGKVSFQLRFKTGVFFLRPPPFLNGFCGQNLGLIYTESSDPLWDEKWGKWLTAFCCSHSIKPIRAMYCIAYMNGQMLDFVFKLNVGKSINKKPHPCGINLGLKIKMDDGLPDMNSKFLNFQLKYMSQYPI